MPEEQVFISYSRQDKKWLEKLQMMLKPLARKGSISVWDDTKINSGTKWKEEIEDALTAAKVAVLLVSPHFLGSAFIVEHELPPLLEAAKKRGLVILWIYISHCLYDETEIEGYQAAHEISKPLDHLTPPEQRRVLAEVCRKIKAAANPLCTSQEVLSDYAGDVLATFEDESRQLSPSLRACFAELNRDVWQLTQDQFRVIQYLIDCRRVRVSGSAGSGKTVVAAEKASRLAAAGHRVLLVCHNPHLAEHIGRLVAGTSTEVADFVSWLTAIGGIKDDTRRLNWSHFNEPDQAALDRALECLSNIDMKYDAIIVDEAQDFRDEWWVVIETALRSPSESIFYLFYDNHQSLLPHRGQYPIDVPVNLSRNCRNAGRIFDLMRCFDNSSPETENKLNTKGQASLTFYEPGKEREQVALLLRDLHRRDIISDTVILWAGTEPVSDCPLANLEVDSSEVDSWQDEVCRQFQKILKEYDRRGVTFPRGSDVWVNKELGGLSQNQFPSSDDIERVRNVARAFSVHKDTRDTILSVKPYSYGFSWTQDNRCLRLRRKASGLVWAAEGILHFLREDWYVGIPKPITLRVSPSFASRSGLTIPLYAVPDFKGLEADTIILVIRGRTMSYKQMIYVGVSRARAMLAVLADRASAATFPRTFKWDSIS